MFVSWNRKGATFFDKRSRGHYQYERPFMLSVEDPNDPENDLAKGSYNAPRIRQVGMMCIFPSIFPLISCLLGSSTAQSSIWQRLH